MATPGTNFWEEIQVKRIGCNKPGINKAAQAVAKNFQSILDAGVLIIQHSSEEVTGKVQKYARMDARQFVPYSSWGEGYFISNMWWSPQNPFAFKWFQNFCWKCIPGFRFFFHFRGPLGLVCEKFHDIGNVANLKNMIIWSTSTGWWEYLLLNIKLIWPKIVFGEWNQANVCQESHLGTELLWNSTWFNPIQEFLMPSSGVLAEQGGPNLSKSPMAQYGSAPPPPPATAMVNWP